MIDKRKRKREFEGVTKKRVTASRKKKLDYPEETKGSRLAAEIRRRANKLTPEQRRGHFEKAMAMIYGGDPATKATGARH